MKYSKVLGKLKTIGLAIWDYFFFLTIINSQVNGKIFIIRRFNHYDVSAGGCYQSGKYVTNMWNKMVKNIPKAHPIKNILVLGLGSGDSIRKIHKKYKSAQIIAVEYDPVMVEIAKRFVFGKNKYCPQIMINDANEALDLLIKQNKKFDIVIADIFNGVLPSPLLYNDEFLAKITKVLEHNAYLLVNFYRNKTTLEPVYDTKFSKWKNERYRYNQLAVYRPFGNGRVGDPIPDGLMFKEQSKIYQDFSIKHFIKSTPLNKDSVWGQRFKWKFICIDVYHSDREPTIEKIKGLQLVIWHPITKIAKINGWYRNLFIKYGSQNGFVHIKKNYWSDWTQHANRHRKEWLKSERYEICNVTLDEFEKAYHESKKLSGFLRKAFLKSVRTQLKDNKCTIDIVLVRDKNTAKYVAGLITTNYPDISLSIHTISFMRKDVKNTPVGYGVIINWYESAIKNNINWLNYGLLWKKGDPKEWKGYSKFKRQFKPYLIIFPRPYIKLLFNK